MAIEGVEPSARQSRPRRRGREPGVAAIAAESRERAALLRVAAACAGANRLSDVLELAAEEARASVGAASLSVGRFDAGQRVLEVLINTGALGPGEVRFPEGELYRLEDFPLLARMLSDGAPYFTSVDRPDVHPQQVELLERLGKSSDLGVPILVEGHIWGEVWAAKAIGEPPFRAEDVNFLELIAGQIATAIARVEMFTRVSRLAYEDALTGLPNRRAFEERLDRALSRLGDEETVSLLVCDLDGLKKINDTRGHAAGDAALVHAAETLVRASAERPGAFAARLSGDEFCVLLEDHDLFEAVSLGSATLELLGDSPSEAGAISLSFGAAAAAGQTSASELMRAADTALYAAKRRGGARVCSVAETLQDPEPAPEDELERRIPARGRLDHLIDSIAASLDEALADAPAVDRIEAVAQGFMLSWNFASWAISVVPPRAEALIDIANGWNREGAAYGGMRFAPGAEQYPLAEFPASAELVRAGGGSFVVSVDDPDSDPDEVALLRGMGMLCSIAAVATCDEGTFMLELFGDAETEPAAEAERSVRLLLRAAMPSQPPHSLSTAASARIELARQATAHARALAHAHDVERASAVTAERLAEAYDCHVVHVVRIDGEQLVLSSEAGRASTAVGWSQHVDSGLIGRCLREQEPVLAADVRREPQYRGTAATRGVRSELVVPLEVFGRPWGVLNLEQLEVGAFAAEDVSVVETFAAQLASRLDAIEIYRSLDDAYVGTVEALTEALEAKDAYTAEHSRSIASHAQAVGERLGMDGEGLRFLRYAAAFHDIGKIAVPESVLHKPGPLDPDERALIERHTVVGERILSPVGFLAPALPIVRSAHERWDGAGYPDGLGGERIPLGARILFACDAYDAMTTDRPYRRSLGDAVAREELRRNAGTQFDPEVVRALLGVLRG